MLSNRFQKLIHALSSSLLGLLCLWVASTSNVYAVIEIEITQGGESAILAMETGE